MAGLNLEMEALNGNEENEENQRGMALVIICSLLLVVRCLLSPLSFLLPSLSFLLLFFLALLSLSLASISTKKRAVHKCINYYSSKERFNHMRKAQDEFLASNMSNKDFAKQRGIDESTFNRYRRNGFPSSWEEAQQQGRGSGNYQRTPAEAEKLDAFTQRNLDYENNAALRKAFKRDFPEITDSKKRGNRLSVIRGKIAKINAENDGLNAAASANAGAGASDEPFDAEESDFV